MFTDQLIEEKFREIDNKLKQLKTADVPDHRHNGFDSSQVNFSDLKQSLKDLYIKGLVRIVSVGGSIQKAIDEFDVIGLGGVVKLEPGIYNITTPLIGSSGITIEGSAASTTILNFGSTSANLSFEGTSIYTTGTITVASGVNITGSGTSWLANVTTSHQLFLGTRWYKIAAITSDTTLILAEAYGDNVTLPSTYRIAIPKQDINLKELTLQGSTGTGLESTDCRNIDFNNVNFIQNNKGFILTNISEISMSSCVAAGSTSNGYELTNCGLGEIRSLASSGNGGHGCTLNNIKTITFFASSSTGNASDGFNGTTVKSSSFAIEASGNGGQGIEFVSGCDSNFISSPLLASNTSDGIKLTATSDGNVIVAGSITANGGYGINIAASTCDNNTIIGPYFAGNSSGTINNSGTNTNILSSGGIDVQTFSTAGIHTWTKPVINPKLVTIKAWGAGASGGRSNNGAQICGGGGGGAYSEITFLASTISGTAEVVVGTGGAAQTGVDNGNAGTQSSFGTATYYAVAYAGGRGGGGAVIGSGGGGAGELSNGGNASGATRGAATLLSGPEGGTASSGNAGTATLWTGGAGGAGNNVVDPVGNAGNGYYGGGGGGGASATGGTSLYGGAGGGGGDGTNGVAGTQPGGGGGATNNGTQSGAGGDGKVIVISY